MRKLKQVVKAAPAVSGLLLLSNSPVLAQIDLAPKEQFETLGQITIGNIVGGLITLSLIIAAVVFFFILVIGGIRWIISGGDKAQTEGARGQITAALVGLVIVFSAWAILQLVNTLFGVDILRELNIPSFLGGGVTFTTPVGPAPPR